MKEEPEDTSLKSDKKSRGKKAWLTFSEKAREKIVNNERK